MGMVVASGEGEKNHSSETELWCSGQVGFEQGVTAGRLRMRRPKDGTSDVEAHGQSEARPAGLLADDGAERSY